MLELKHIVKDYVTGDTTVRALKGIDLAFRRSEFVSILGPSGCGKTTLLNIVGGLDRYTEGDLVISGKSTKDFKAADWDAYRNHRIGFVFQNYNLIPHLTVLGNVELALTLSGVTPAERRKRAAAALESVGLGAQLNKRPNQLSGGQMQRVAIARALVNDPEIILADEPTGALDSVTSVQISDLLKEISKDRLIIMVTHNDKLAEKYSTRIIRLLDGNIVDDSNPYTAEEAALEAQDDTPKQPVQTAPAESKKGGGKDKTAMSFFTALSLSFKNLVTKKGRTFMTSFAGSIGIIGIALVLAVSNGFSQYIDRMQSDMLAGYPLQINTIGLDMDMAQSGHGSDKGEAFPDSGTIKPYEPNVQMFHYNNITQEYIDRVEQLDAALYNAVDYSYAVGMHVFSMSGDTPVELNYKANGNDMMGLVGVRQYYWQELIDNDAFMQTQYSVISGKYPTQTNEIALVIDKYNRLSTSMLTQLDIPYSGEGEIRFEDVLGKTYRVIDNDTYYNYDVANKYCSKNSITAEVYGQGFELKIVGIMRVNEDAPLELFNNGLVYTSSLTDMVVEKANGSVVAKAQEANPGRNIVENKNFDLTKPQEILEAMQNLGVITSPSSIYIFPKNFETKEEIKSFLNVYNEDKGDLGKVVITDAASILTDTMTQMVDIISYVLIAFAAVSLVVSSIMIGIITYVSVIERTKEIGVLRSIGARKKDITRVFNAETLIIGCVAGVIGVLISFILTFPINAIIGVLTSGMNVGNMAVLNPLHAVLLVVVSMVLTLVSGLMPAVYASKKDPVVALRTE